MTRPYTSVTAVMTTYNHAPYVGAALRSVLDQTYPPSEVIVVDDGSTDQTPDVLAAFQAEIKYIRQANRGVAGSRNRGIAEATGDLVALIDGDDLWEPEKIARQVEAFEAYPDSGLVACAARQFAGDRVIWEPSLRSIAPEFFDDGGRDTVSRHCYERLLRSNLFSTTSQVIIPRTVLREVGPSDVRLPTSSDYDLYLRIAAKYPLTLVDMPLTRWRYLPTSASGPAARRDLRWAEDVIVILRKQLHSRVPVEAQVVKDTLSATVNHTARLAYDHGSETDRRWALGYALRLAARNPNYAAVWFYLGGLLAGPWLSGLVGSWVSALSRRVRLR